MLSAVFLLILCVQVGPVRLSTRLTAELKLVHKGAGNCVIIVIIVIGGGVFLSFFLSFFSV